MYVVVYFQSLVTLMTHSAKFKGRSSIARVSMDRHVSLNPFGPVAYHVPSLWIWMYILGV